MSFKDKLTDLHDAMNDAAKEAAEGLHNQNLADVLRAGAARLAQALGHPDIERVGTDDAEKERISRDRDGAALNSGGNALFAAGDPGTELQRTEAARRATFPGGSHGAPTADAPGYVDPVTTLPASPPANPFDLPNSSPPRDPATGQPVDGRPLAPGLDPEAKHPGDPSFVKQNTDFTEPNAVDLNKDGTLKTAPNTKGASDERDGGKKE